MELGPEDVSLLEMCPHFRGCYVQISGTLSQCISIPSCVQVSQARADEPTVC